jgi:hypothetical protein
LKKLFTFSPEGEGQDEAVLKNNGSPDMNALTPVVPAWAQKNHLCPFGGEKVHRTFSCFRLTSRREREFFDKLLEDR